MKKLLLLSIIILSISCTKQVDKQARLLSDTTSADTLFIVSEKATKFTVPEVGWRLDYLIKSCKDAHLELNTNDGKGWKSQQAAIGLMNGDLIFIYWFRYRFNIVRNDGTNWISSERICQF
jgi:hypothetical protein